MPQRGKLDTYRAKRSANATPEPFGGGETPAQGPRPFVIHKHSATRLHYDLRLELGGVLRCWAIPKGPSLDPDEKRLAVEVEDHPVEYANFEGVIPRGNYGAGPVILWDRGVWVPWENPEAALQTGTLAFELRGYKLRGIWHLVRTGPRKTPGKEWLLIKKVDAYSRKGEPPYGEESILSGLTLEELEQGPARAAALRQALAEAGATPTPVLASKVELMLAETAERPFSGKGWFFELKYDGFRLLLERDGAEGRMLYRRGNDATSNFPEVARALRALPFDQLVLDGEVVVLDAEGKPHFQSLQKRNQLGRAQDVERASIELPATVYCFDALGIEGYDLRKLPLVERKRFLRQVLPRTGPLRYADEVPEHGEALFEEVRGRGLEGVMAKRADAPYTGGRQARWLKVRVERSEDFVVVGFTLPEGSRIGFGALHLAAWDADKLVYTGRVGTGFDDALLARMRPVLDGLRQPKPACEGTFARDRRQVWVRPSLVCEVRYHAWTDEGLLRFPVFVRFRDDKGAEECFRHAPHVEPAAPETRAIEPPRSVPTSNLTKVFWPDEGYTKGDLIAYYESVARFLLPYLQDRPLVLTRYPDGIAGKSFFQKDGSRIAPPTWVRTRSLWSDHSTREIEYFVAEDVQTLVYLANLGTIPLHIWASRLRSLPHPDWCVLDLDPKGAPFAHVVRIARAIHEVTEQIGLPSYVKTSGSTGLHVMLPLGRQCTFEQSRGLAELLAWIVARDLPEIASLSNAPSQRGGRVYLDCLRNLHGALTAAPLCVREKPGATVSTPLAWDEVNHELDPSRFTIRSVLRRLEVRGDPLRGILEDQPDLLGALQRLDRRLPH